MPTSSLAVANFFIKKSFDTGGAKLTPMKLIKMVYIAHGWYLAIKNEPLIGEAVEAWKYGPVVPTVYRTFCRFKDQQITQMGKIFDDENSLFPYVNDKDTVDFLEKIWAAYSRFTGLQLSAITHEMGTPWYKIWHESEGYKNSNFLIPNEIIKDHYKELADARNKNKNV